MSMNRAMKKENVTRDDVEEILDQKGISSVDKKETIIRRLQVNGCLIAMISDILDEFISDEMDLIRLLDMKYKHEQQMHKNEMLAAKKKFHYHMTGFTKNFFEGTTFQDDLEDNAQDLYEIIKLITDHTNDHKDMETIKRNLRRRKLNHHIFEL